MFRGEQCGYFCWADELGKQPSGSMNQASRGAASFTPSANRSGGSNTLRGRGGGRGFTGSGRGNDDPVCFHCQQSGHFARQCPNRAT